MPDDAIIIRNAVVEDVPFIKSCIHELAEYEHSAELDKSTVEMLRENIFVKGFAKVLIAECMARKRALRSGSTTSPHGWRVQASIWRMIESPGCCVCDSF